MIVNMSDLTKMPLFHLLPKISKDRIRAEQKAAEPPPYIPSRKKRGTKK